ncbi:chaperone-modulator protein CbpM [Kordia sp. SMS9]|uniref:chaperone modulator CbpM n=1 Tax=Kordia sp. SMS9 TaxID=2282170 RepID=UPI000E0DB2DB|nr:chaperone modulator CbpM [Kordia sp. SMS9]AXG70907.1 chaperone-modulator protein CbpM [Kordia sp. SMS9]
MERKDLISIQQFCIHYNIPSSFINALQEYELVEIIVSNDTHYIKTTQISHLEKIMRLHFELNINLEGVDVIYNLLKRIEYLQNEVTTLKNQLRRYEDF